MRTAVVGRLLATSLLATSLVPVAGRVLGSHSLHAARLKQRLRVVGLPQAQRDGLDLGQAQIGAAEAFLERRAHAPGELGVELAREVAGVALERAARQATTLGPEIADRITWQQADMLKYRVLTAPLAVESSLPLPRSSAFRSTRSASAKRWTISDPSIRAPSRAP